MANREKVVIDTNLLVRYISDDDPAKSKSVDNLLTKAMNGEIQVLIPSIVIAELVWVLESFYEMKATDITGIVQAILNTPGIEVTDRQVIESALLLYKSQNIDLIDAWIIEFAKDRNIKAIYTFDKKHFKRVKDIEIRKP
ncbi:MAG: PIN domain-containing protein [bacterium]